MTIFTKHLRKIVENEFHIIDLYKQATDIFNRIEENKAKDDDQKNLSSLKKQIINLRPSLNDLDKENQNKEIKKLSEQKSQTLENCTAPYEFILETLSFLNRAFNPFI